MTPDWACSSFLARPVRRRWWFLNGLPVGVAARGGLDWLCVTAQAAIKPSPRSARSRCTASVVSALIRLARAWWRSVDSIGLAGGTQVNDPLFRNTGNQAQTVRHGGSVERQAQVCVRCVGPKQRSKGWMCVSGVWRASAPIWLLAASWVISEQTLLRWFT